MVVQGEDAPPAARSVEPLALWKFVPVAFLVALVVVVPVVIGLSHLVVWISSTLPPSQLSAADQQAMGAPPLACAFRGADGLLAVLACPSGERRAHIFGVRPMPGLPDAAARQGLADGLAEYTRLSDGLQPTCELWTLEAGPAASCGAARLPDLSAHLVATGRAGAAVPALHSLEDAARSAGRGLHADAAALRRADLRAVQGWLATALGLMGAMAGILYTGQLSAREWRFRQQLVKERLAELLRECNAAYGKWFRGDEGAGDFPAKLEELRAFLERERAAGGWSRKHAISVQTVKRKAGDPDMAATATDQRKDVVKVDWEEVLEGLKPLTEGSR